MGSFLTASYSERFAATVHLKVLAQLHADTWEDSKYGDWPLVTFKFFLFIGPKNAVLRLAVKFFPPDPGQLQEEYTR